MTPLAPSQLNLLRVRGGLAALVPLAAAIAAELVLKSGNPLPFGLLIGAALLLVLLLVLVLPVRRYRAWSYDATGDELHIHSGIWVHSRTVVPYGRVQHIDVSQGPLERRFGVGTLTLHTAGTRNAAVSLPGLEMSQAEGMRDGIRAQIRQDLV